MTFGKALREHLEKNPNDFDRLSLLNAASLAMRRETSKIIGELHYPAVRER